MGFVVGYDVTHANLPQAPKGQLAGYSTGLGPDIKWTTQDWTNHPGALRIDQDVNASDFTADYLDIETNAATANEAADWYLRALDSFNMVRRPGQRRPGFYMSASNVTEVVNAVVAAGIRSGPCLIVANWNLTEPQAVADVLAGAGPYPIHGVQFKNNGPYDIDVWDSNWLADVSKPKPSPLTMLKQAQASLMDSQGDLAEAIADIATVIKGLTG